MPSIYLRMNLFARLFLFSTILLSYTCAMAQPKLEFNLKKPKQYENRQLPSEKLAAKRFTGMRHFFQNNYTHYNYFFNANLKLNEIISDSKLQFKDDYTELLSFYPYSLDETSRSNFLDSILQRCTAGILLHDLRNEWIDNMYLVMGKAYLLRKNFDSAAMTFQFINYTFAPKEKGGFDKVIGSNSEEGNNAFTIATKEKTGTFSYLVTRPPSRNEAFVWQVRTLIENGEYLDASSLIETLKNDPYFPARLKEEMAEARSYLYYKMEIWDSSATYLVKAIPNAENQQEKARAWYLAGQLYQLGNNLPKASEAYEKCTGLALDPVMEVYARLNSIRLNKSDDPKIIDANIATLLSMAKKDKYQSYRDIIYYATALFELERNGYAPATSFLQKSIKFNNEDEAQRTRSFMLLGDIAYAQKNYANAAPYYDSVNTNAINKETAARLEKRHPGTKQIYQAVQVITLNDSLLTLAETNETERIARVKKISKQLRKERGLKEDPLAAGGSVPVASLNPSKSNAAATSLFDANSSTWYFYDVSVRANGFGKFKERWGARPNVDNWRRLNAIQLSALKAGVVDDSDDENPALKTDTTGESFDTTDISFDNLYSRIPLSAERKERADNRINIALYNKGVALHEQLEDYPEAIKVFEKLLSRKDTGTMAEQSLFALVHCYTQIGDLANANRCKQLLQKQFAGGALSQKVSRKELADEKKSDQKVTGTYQKIYDLFIEGNFEEAIAAKKLADSTLGKNYWTPQLLYIESVYHIRQKDDSLAIKSLNDINTEFPDHPLSARATRMIEVLGRRKEIEDYLTKLEVTRAKEDEVVVSRPEPRKDIVMTPDSLKRANITAPVIKPTKDSSTILITAVATQPSPYIINGAEPFMVALVMEKVDPAYVNEALYSLNNSSRKNFNGQPVEATKKKLRDNLWIIMLRSPEFKNAEAAVNYINYLKPVAQKEIISWLDTSKYSYIILNEANLSLLSQDPNMPLYQKVLKETFPGKF
ncbi:hypothetical protein BH10BAC3_BH10BAC3_27180 [soil metagenome]